MSEVHYADQTEVGRASTDLGALSTAASHDDAVFTTVQCRQSVRDALIDGASMRTWLRELSCLKGVMCLVQHLRTLDGR